MIHRDTDRSIDVLFVAEGTYPYIRGGVSSWIHQIITGMKDVSFGVLFLGSREEDYKGIRYNLPDNLIYLESFFLFSQRERPEPEVREGSEEVNRLKAFLIEGSDIPPELSEVDFFRKRVSFSDMLYGRRTLEMLEDLYQETDMDVPFVDFFWTVRNIFSPIWVLVEAVERVRERDIALIHSPSTGYAGFLGAMLKRAMGSPFIITEHGIYTRERKIDILNSQWIGGTSSIAGDRYDIDDLRKLWINFFVNVGKVCYREADRVYSLFEGARQIQIRLGCPPEKTASIPNGVELDRYREVRKRRRGVPEPIVALIGRVTPIKDIKTFIKGMKLLIDKIPEAEGWIIGPQEEDPAYVEECRMMIRTLGLEERVKLLGFRRMEEVLSEVGITALTSISEGMPIVVLESLASGVPCVATDVGSCKQLLYGGLNEEDRSIGKAGEVVPVSDPGAFADACFRLLRDPERWKRCSYAGVERVERFYSYERFIKNYRSVYDFLMEAGVGGRIH